MKRTKITRRLTSLLLTLALALGLLPGAALAAEEEAEPAPVAVEELPEIPAPEDEPAEEAAEETADEEALVSLAEALEDEPQPLADTEYSKEFSGDMDAIMPFGFNSMSFTVKTTDANGAKLTDAKGSVLMTDRGDEYDDILAKLIAGGVSVDPRTAYIFQLDCPVDLDSAKTSVDVSCNWMTANGKP